MKMIILGVSSLLGVVACGSNVVVGEAAGGNSGANSADAGSGGAAVTWTDPTAAPGCAGSPASLVSYSTADELNALMIGQWRRCLAPQIPGEDVGVEFTADGNYYPLTFDSTHHVVRRTGIDYAGSWVYFAPGSVDPISNQPSDQASMELSGVFTSPPQFTVDPQQMRITFSPVLSKYVPLTP
jgi:hypothetical protein